MSGARRGQAGVPSPGWPTEDAKDLAAWKNVPAAVGERTTPSRSGMLALQRAVGNLAVGRLIGSDQPHSRVVQRDFLGIGNALGDLFNTRYNEKERDEYEDSMSQLADVKKKSPTMERNQTSTGSGMFDVAYAPGEGRLTITVRCHFKFVDSVVERIVDPKSDPHAPKMKDVLARWTEAEKSTWMAQFFAQASGVWKDTHTFWCQRDWWESLKATTRVQFVYEPEENPFKYHFYVRVHKRESLDKGPTHTVGTVLHQADWGENLLDPNAKGQPTAAHEAGHMLGLGDEYDGPGAGPIQHDTLVKAQFGKVLIQGRVDPASIMADGAKVLPEHGVTFFEALERLTPNARWGREPKPPRSVPATQASGQAGPSGQAPRPDRDPDERTGAADPSALGSAGGLGTGPVDSPPGFGPL